MAWSDWSDGDVLRAGSLNNNFDSVQLQINNFASASEKGAVISGTNYTVIGSDVFVPATSGNMIVGAKISFYEKVSDVAAQADEHGYYRIRISGAGFMPISSEWISPNYHSVSNFTYTQHTGKFKTSTISTSTNPNVWNGTDMVEGVGMVGSYVLFRDYKTTGSLWVSGESIDVLYFDQGRVF